MSQNQKPTDRYFGYLIENEKQKSTQPDLKGKVTIQGKEWLLAVWSKGKKDGKDMFSIEATDPEVVAKKFGNPENRQNSVNSNSESSENKSPSFTPSSNHQNNSNQNYSNQNNQNENTEDHAVKDDFGSVFDGLP